MIDWFECFVYPDGHFEVLTAACPIPERNFRERNGVRIQVGRSGLMRRTPWEVPDWYVNRAVDIEARAREMAAAYFSLYDEFDREAAPYCRAYGMAEDEAARKRDRVMAEAERQMAAAEDDYHRAMEAARSVYLEAIAPYYARLLATLRVFGEVSLVEEVPHGDESTED